jgi:hypothetical protein
MPAICLQRLLRGNDATANGRRYRRAVILDGARHGANGRKPARGNAAILEGDDIDLRKAEIIENLHRAELTVQERAEWTAALVELCEEKVGQVDPVSAGGSGNEGGIRQAARELKKPSESEEGARSRIRRDKKIAAASDEAKQAARAAGPTGSMWARGHDRRPAARGPKDIDFPCSMRPKVAG